MDKIELIKFSEKDASFILKNFPTYFSNNNIENVKSILKKWENSLAFCILYNGQKVGIITLGEKQDRSLSWGVMVKEAFRRKGIAQNAFKLIKQKAIEKGFSTIISSCDLKNEASKNLHEKVGFRLVKIEENKNGKLMCRWEMKI